MEVSAADTAKSPSGNARVLPPLEYHQPMGPVTRTVAPAPTPRAQGKRLDSMADHSGVVSESQHLAMRADIRLLSTLLGETLARQGGQELLELVEQVRRLARTALLDSSAEVRSLLSTLDGTSVQLTRAFSTYFQLTNVAEQLHRSREQRTQVGGPHGRLRAVVARLARARAVAYYLEQLGTHAVPDLLEDLETELARESFVLPPRSRPLVLGCWVGGIATATPTSHHRSPSTSCGSMQTGRCTSN
ncbi:MAG: phosphoenolpyruvate carboxylase [Actinomycetota bacterium]|nr:phosphoenolpyruvate carboxylase [Actinomycetota bacterium]